MPPDNRHRNRRRIARYYLIGLFLAMRAADALLWVYAFDLVNPWPFLRGQIPGSILGTTVLLFYISRRQMWARYALIFFIWYTVALFSTALLVAIQEHHSAVNRPIAAGAAGVIIYVAVNIVIIRSRKIQSLAHSGGIDG